MSNDSGKIFELQDEKKPVKKKSEILSKKNTQLQKKNTNVKKKCLKLLHGKPM